MEQHIIQIRDNYNELDECLKTSGCKKILLVCGSSVRYLGYDSYFRELEQRIGIRVVRFSDFSPNPDYESVVKGLQLFNSEKCDSIIAVGGGSAMDVAKCIKIFNSRNLNENICDKDDVKLMAVPTTAGTGSEATHFAVIYYSGEKQSVTDINCIPSVVVMDGSVLAALPLYQKKVTLLDALCHSVESYWSVNSTDESKEFSTQAIKLILSNMDFYLDISGHTVDVSGLKDNVMARVLKKDNDISRLMLYAAYLAGKAINITKTTAGHAMCYKLTTMYGISHGHAAALCVAKLFPYMINHIDQCSDGRGAAYLDKMFDELAATMGCRNKDEAGALFDNIINKLELSIPNVSPRDYEVLRTSVNIERLKNNPISLSENEIDYLYHQILDKAQY